MPKPEHSDVNVLTFKVTINGNDFEQAAPGGISQIIVERHVEMVGMAQIALMVNPLVEPDGFTPPGMGQPIEVELGGKKVFKGIITEIRFSAGLGESTATIVAMDALVKLVASTRTKVYEESKDSDIASSVIGASGASADVEATSVTHKYVLQRSESDYFFLKRLAARNSYFLFADTTGKILFKKAEFTNGQDWEYEFGNNILSYDFGWSTAQLPSDVKVFGWDYAKKETVSNTAASGDVPVIGDGTNLLSDRGDIYGTNKTIVDVLVSSQDAAKSMAVSELSRLGLNATRGVLVVQGNGEVEPGNQVKVTNFVKGGNACGVVIGVKHTVEAGNWSTSIYFAGNAKPT